MDKPTAIINDIYVLPSYFPILDIGVLPINAFLIMGKEPMLIDTGAGMDNASFIQAFTSVIDPKDLKWIWLTHDDADHTGNLHQVLNMAPNATLIANSLATLRMNTLQPIPMERVYWLNPGESIHISDRDLLALRPPIFDNPTTITIYDAKSEAYFSGDCFGGIISKPVAYANDIPEEHLSNSQINWASLDSPWIHLVDKTKFHKTIGTLQKLTPKMVFSSHLPPAKDKFNDFLDLLAQIPDSSPAMTPNQDVLKQVLTQVKGD